jgi:hypothetical protein
MGLLNRHCRLPLRVLFGFLPVAVGWSQPTREYDLKAAFLYNFASFVDWPPQAFHDDDAPFVIGILGHDPFGPVLDEMVRGEWAKNRPLVVRRLARPAEIPHCQIVFISRSEASRIAEVLRYCVGRAVLTVADLPGFVELGGMIGFSNEGNRVLLQVNPRAAAAVELVISSKLLRVAHHVTGGRDP